MAKPTKPQLRALRLMASEDDGPFSAGNLPIHKLSNRMVTSHRLAHSLVEKGFATQPYNNSDRLYITDLGRAAIADTHNASQPTSVDNLNATT